MGKNIMKSVRVAVLMIIMMSFVQILEADQLSCIKLCAVDCLPDQVHYYQCFIACTKRCPPHTGASNCIKSCGVNKTITVDMGIYL